MRVIDALDAAGKDIILIETVGTGQSEIDVAEVADVRVLVTAPGLGDDIQAMKAGLIEIADIMVVNKADREGADRAAQQLKGALSLRAHDRVKVPVLKTTATTGEGVRRWARPSRRPAPAPPPARRRSAAAAAPATSSPAPPPMPSPSGSGPTRAAIWTPWRTPCCRAACCRPTPPRS